MGPTRLGSKDLIGRVLGGFRIERLIGKGSSGVVYRAMQDSVKRPVALKILTTRWASDATNLARFRREAIAAARIVHPHVVSVIDFGESQGLFYMAMTYVEGQPLSQVIARQGTMDPVFVAGIGAQMASALAAIGAVGLVHRDVKPANIMLAFKDRGAYLTDLGLAKAVDSSQDVTMKGFTVGTPNYIAPEQAMAETDLTIACDVYSLGATLYHAVTGRLVFANDNAFEVMRSHVNDQPEDPRKYARNLPGMMPELLLAMLEKSPASRPSPEDVVASLGRVMGSAPAAQEAAPPAATEQSRAEAAPGASERVGQRLAEEPEVPESVETVESSADTVASPGAGAARLSTASEAGHASGVPPKPRAAPLGSPLETRRIRSGATSQSASKRAPPSPALARGSFPAWLLPGLLMVVGVLIVVLAFVVTSR